MTTLLLARLIAEASRAAGAGDAATQAVLQTLYEHDCWFCRIHENEETGLTEETRLEYVQLELFAPR